MKHLSIKLATLGSSDLTNQNDDLINTLVA